MSRQPILIVIHGMGVHSENSFKEEVVSAGNKALRRYPGHEQDDFEKHVEVKPIAYDHIFETVRQRLVNANAPVAEFFKNNPEINNSLSLSKRMSELESSLGRDEFLSTHVFDVVLYLTLVGGWVRSYVIEKLVNIINENPNRRIHLLAHSLGTAVLHDSLASRLRTDPPSGFKILDSSVSFDSIWTFANVSRLVANYSGRPHPYTTRVKPGEKGCANCFFNVRHKLDPFTRPMRFAPEENPDWVRPVVLEESYGLIETEAISRLNTHDIGGYIEDPKVSLPFLFSLIPSFDPSSDGIKEADAKFQNLQGQYEKIEEKFKDIDDFSDISDFLKLVKDFKVFVESAGTI